MAIVLFFLVLAAFAAILFRLRRSNGIFGMAIAAWIGAFFWNKWILNTCSGDCNIRVDLVLIAPIVLFASALALARLFQLRKS